MPSRLQQLLQMLSAEPGDEFLQYAIAVEYFAAGEFTKAVEALEKLLQQNPQYLAAYYQLGKCHEAQNNTEKAKTTYAVGIEVAQKQGKAKTLNELREALFLLED